MKIICKECRELKEHYAKGLCGTCYRRNYNKKHYLERKEEIINYVKQWRKNNPNKVKKYRKKYIKENPEKYKKSQKKYYLGHKEEEKERLRNYRLNNPEKVKRAKKKYKQSPKGKLNVRRDHFKRRVNGTIKKGIISRIINENILKYGIITCEKCKKECETKFHIDHIIPVSKKGTNDYDNLQVLCADCNQIKYTKIKNYKKNIDIKQMFLKEEVKTNEDYIYRGL